MTLNYRSPDTPELRAKQVLNDLNSEDDFDWVIALAKLLFGVPLCFLPPVVVTLFLFGGRRGLIFSDPKLFLPVLGVTSALLIPVLFYIQSRRPRDFLWEATQEKFTPMTPIAEIALAGPKLILSLIEQLRSDYDPSQEALALAAKIVVQLIDADQTVEIQQLLVNRTPEEVTEALQLLEFRGWVCVSRHRDRVWLGSSIRKQFEALR